MILSIPRRSSRTITGWYTDDLFSFEDVARIIHPVSRLKPALSVQGPMSARGMGAVYARTSL